MVDLALLAACAILSPPAPTWQWTGPAFRAAGAKGAAQLRDGAVLVTHTEGRRGGAAVVCSRSDDGGRTWREAGTIVWDADPHADIGDGALLQRQSGELLYSYRDNRYRAAYTAEPTFAIRVSVSADGGRHWRPHSNVDSSSGAGRGLWSSFLFERGDGTVQCYYDDERTPADAGLAGHQWVTMRTWDARARAWVAPVTVSRAHNSRHLSRDGMPSVVEVRPGRLVCVLESVRTAPPHAGVVLQTTSDDGGRTWSWRREERAVVYQPSDPRFAAYAPWLARLPDGTLVCAFGTNEARSEPSVPGAPPPDLNLDIKCVSSSDGGRSWGPAATIYEGSHRCYMPCVLPLTRRRGSGHVLFLMLDTQSGFWGRLGLREGRTAPR